MPNQVFSQGTPWISRNATASVSAVSPAATFVVTSLTDTGGGTTRLNASGAHGFTNAANVGKYVYISSGTNWTPGFYLVTAIDVDTSGVQITISQTYSASLGNPTLIVVGADFTFQTITVPALSPNAILNLDLTFSYSNTSNTKRITATWGGTAIFDVSPTTSVIVRPASVLMQNRGSTSSQVSAHTVGNTTQASTAGSVITTATINTSAPTTLTLTGRLNNPLDYVKYERYALFIWN